MKLFRLWGLLAFLTLAILSAAIWYFLAPKFIAESIESVGSEILGAKVEVDDIDLELFPLKIKINRLQAADPDQPMKNLFEVKTIRFAVDSNALLWKKILIDELVIEGVNHNTDRASSGKIIGGRKTQQLQNKISSYKIPTFSNDEIKEIINDADLITQKRLDQLNLTQKKLNGEWETALDKKSYDKRISAIKTEYKELTKRSKEDKINLLKDRKKWKKLNHKVKKERQRIANLNKKFKLDTKQIKQQIQAVKQGPNDDLQKIMKDMGIGNGMSGLSDKYLGAKFTPWVTKTIELIKTMKASEETTDKAPVYSSAQGLLVKFTDQQIFPDLLIKKIHLSGNNKDFKVSGNGSNVGYFPWLVGKPAQIDIKLSAAGNASLSINSHWPSEKEMITKVSSIISNWSVKQMKLMESEQGPWIVNSGYLNATLKGNLTLNNLDFNLSINLNQPKIIFPKKLNGWQKDLAINLNQQKNIAIEIKASGTLNKPSIKIKSSLDKLFTQAIGSKIKTQVSKLKQQITQSISNKIGDLSSIDAISEGFSVRGKELNLNDKMLKELL